MDCSSLERDDGEDDVRVEGAELRTCRRLSCAKAERSGLSNKAQCLYEVG